MAVDLQSFYVNETEVAMALEGVQWTQETISELQENINKNNILSLCIADILVSHWQYIAREHLSIAVFTQFFSYQYELYQCTGCCRYSQ